MIAKILLIFADIVLYYLSIIAGYNLRSFLGKIFSFLPKFTISLHFVCLQFWIPLTFLATFLYSGLYTKIRSFWDDLEAILKSFFFFTIIVFSVISFAKLSDRLSRLHLLLSIFIFFWLCVFVRYFFKKVLNRFGIGVKKLFIIGLTENSRALADLIQNDSYLSYKVIGFWDSGYKWKRSGNFKVFRTKNIWRVLKKIKFDAILLSEAYLSSPEFVYRLRNYTKDIILIPNIISPFFIYDSFLFSTLYSNSWVLRLKNNLNEPVNIIIKQMFDIIASTLILFLSLPLMLLIGLMIKLESKGPIIFSHIREGKNGKKIRVYKFRTMYLDSEKRLKEYLKENPLAQEQWDKFRKLAPDPRVTKIGIFLRKTSLDELPQLFNVLKGEMSLVGPRPVTEDEIKNYYKDLSSFYYEVKPGLTGLWQVSGKNKIPYEKRVILDVMYVVNWSVWKDIIILLKTIKVVFKNED